MNPWAILGVLVLLAALGSWGTYEAGESAKWEGQYDSLKASYASAADKARNDAKEQEQKDLANLQSQSSQAIQSAQSKAVEAQRQLSVYQQKIKTASGMKDLPHACANVVIPDDLRP